jgi:hypothetical protein
MSDEGLVRERLRLLPPIRRARLWRLYAEDGRRFLDLWMDGGRSILGAKGTGIGTAAKAAIDTGLTRPFPSVLQARLERSLKKRYTSFVTLRLFRNEDRALAAAETLLPPGSTLQVLRPFAEHDRDAGEPAGIAMPRLPCPAALAPAVLLFREEALARRVEGDILPSLALACAHRALSEFERFEKDYAESLWKRVDRRLGPFFERSGPYLYPRPAAFPGPEGYGRLFAAALGAGILLSPDPEEPSIIPGDFDDGELARLEKALASVTKI